VRMDNHEGTISLCMIARDESGSLERCLESARGFVDEIIVVDTGSRDTTIAVAERCGARVYRFPWQDDFSLARNESLKHAIGEWVLVLDADEELPPETAQNLRRLACDDVEAWTFTIISPCPPDRPGQQEKHPGLRMFKNRGAYLFEGRVHEQIRPSIIRANPGAVILHSGAVILHHGYARDAKQRREKTLRNISILKQELAARPDDPFQNYNLGLSYYALGDLEGSRRHYEAARRYLDPRDGFTPAFFRNYSLCLGDLGDYEQALNLVDEGLACWPDYPDLYFIKGQLCWDLNLMAQAKASFLKCLRFRQTLPGYITTEGVTGCLALENLSEVCAREKNFDEAVTYLEQVLRIRPTHELFVRLCSLLQQKGLDGDRVAAYLEESFRLDNTAIARVLSDIKEERILRLALEALLDGDCDPSLAAAPGEARQALENYVLEAGYSREALQQLENTRGAGPLSAAGTLQVPASASSLPTLGGMPAAGISYLLGTACADLDRHDQAFLYFVQAGMQEPGNELYAACALEQLASKCLLHIGRMLGLEEKRPELRKELFKLTSLKNKTQRLKRNLMKRDLEAPGAGCRNTGAECPKAGNKSEAEVEFRKTDTGSHDAGPEDSPCISIVMPVCTNPDVTGEALEAITSCTDCSYEIIIVDNGSDQACKAVIAGFERRQPGLVRVICNESNRGYPIACNQGLAVSRGQYPVIMNNDVLVTPHWASRMIAAFSGDPRTGVVGPRTNYVFGEQLVRECSYRIERRPVSPGGTPPPGEYPYGICEGTPSAGATLNEWSQQWYERHAGSRQPSLRLVGFLMMIRREVVREIGGFDPVFGLGNFEDDDYCVRARLAGYQLAIANDVFVHHYGSVSFIKKPAAYSQLLETNRRLFAAKWGLDLDNGSREHALAGAFDRDKLHVPLD
jgi:GT2 family glycosyltransferase/tetratricopeptide (TPR) repeat protein